MSDITSTAPIVRDLLDDQEIRHMAIMLLKAPTQRDQQRRVGASNLSNGCDYCLAANFLGDDRATPITDKAWLGKTWGTAQHGIMENRVNAALETFDGLEGESLRLAREQVLTMLGLFPEAVAERHVFFATIAGYGPVGGTIDLDLVRQIVDWKGTKRQKLCLLIDWLAIQRGEEPPYGRKNTWVKLSEKEYDAEMLAMAFKVDGYYGQQTLYMHGSGAERASLVFLSRDGTGMFDNPAQARYDDPKAVHDVYVLSFDYDEDYALALIARADAIWAHLAAGGVPADFDHHAQCFPCGQDSKELLKAATVDVDIDLTFPAAA